MILVEISKNGVEKVFVRADCEAEQDRDLEIWPTVRRGLNSIARDIDRQATRPNVRGTEK
jgi:hypothetical protein